MGREVRRVPKDWRHPKNESGIYIPLFDGKDYEEAAADWLGRANKDGLQAVIDAYRLPPDINDYMPAWPEAERTHLMMYENVSEGTPISPAFETPEELARWLANTGASAFGQQGASYEGWLRVCNGGYAPSMVVCNGVIQSGVDADLADRGAGND